MFLYKIILCNVCIWCIFWTTRNKYVLHVNNTICVATELLNTSCIKHNFTIPVNNTSVTICVATELLQWAALNPCFNSVVHRPVTDCAQTCYILYKICCVGVMNTVTEEEVRNSPLSSGKDLQMQVCIHDAKTRHWSYAGPGTIISWR